MANNLFINILPRRITVFYFKLKYTTSKIQKTASSIGFINHALAINVTPKFAKVNGQFIDVKDRLDAERKLLISHLQNHKKKLNCLIKDKDQISAQIVNSSSNIFLILIQRYILMNLSKDNYIQLNIKVNKLRRLKPQNTYNYNVPVINISSKDLNTTQLKYGLHHCFIDKKKFTKQNVAIEIENLAANLNKFIKDDQREEFHNFLRSSTNIISKNIFHSKDHTFSKLNELRKDDTIVILPADKESSCVIMDKDDYINKVSCMITEGITDMKYARCDDTILKNFLKFPMVLVKKF